MIKGIVFLGNPGREYAQTRHNLGWMVAESLSFYRQLNWTRKFRGEYSSHPVEQVKRWFLKPGIYMNRSGESVQAFMHFFKIKPQEVLIIHDDLELDFGTAGFKQGGGLAGHNGLRSIAGCLGTGDFYRFRLGISRPRAGSVHSHVLSRFSRDESIVLENYLQKAARLLEDVLGINPTTAAGEYPRIRLTE